MGSWLHNMTHRKTGYFRIISELGKKIPSPANLHVGMPLELADNLKFTHFAVLPSRTCDPRMSQTVSIRAM